MAAAIGPGGAEMGQSSSRVAAPSAGSKSTVTEALTTEGTWTPTFGVQGLDVSGHQPSVNWQQQWNMGARFAYVKASEGNYYTNEVFGSQYQGSRSVGMIRGAYHFAIPNWSSGADQARYFVQNGGGWSPDGSTLPPVLDFEFNPYAGRTISGFYFGNTCYDMSPAQLTSWVRDFGSTMQALTGRLPVIYTNTSWWNQCLGNPAGFGDYPLWIAAYPSSFTNNAGPVPSASWGSYSIWQYSSTGPFAGDSNVWNGDYASLQRFASVPEGRTSSFVIGPNGGTIYLVNGRTKYPIPSWETYQLYSGLGSLSQVTQQTLDSLATGNSVGRFSRSPGGDIYFIDSGRRFHVPNCGVMADFGGGNCSAWTPLYDVQLSRFADAGKLANATASPSGKLFYIASTTKREFFDQASLAAAGLPSAIANLSDAVTASMPYAEAAPVVRPDVIVVNRNTRAPFIFSDSTLLPVPASINEENVWARSMDAAALDPQSISKMTTGQPFVGFATSLGNPARFVIGSNAKYPISDLNNWPNSPVRFSDALLNRIGTGTTIGSPAFVRSSSSPVVYRKDLSARAVPDLATLTQLGRGSIPPIFWLSDTTASALVKGPPVLPLAKLVVGDVSPVVYLVDGVDKMLQLEDFRISDNLGVKGYTRVPQGNLAPYSSSGTVVPALRCGSDTYLGYGGGIWALPASTATTQLPARTLQDSTCQGLPPVKGRIDSTIFVKSLDSSVVYLISDGTKRAISSWSRLVELNTAGSPIIAEYSRSALESIPVGSPA